MTMIIDPWNKHHETMEQEIRRHEAERRSRKFWSKLNVSTRLRNCMVNESIEDLSQLAKLGARAMKLIPNVGKLTVSEARDLLAQHGLVFADEAPSTTVDVMSSKGDLLPVHIIMAAYLLKEAGWTVTPPSTLAPTAPVAAPARPLGG